MMTGRPGESSRDRVGQLRIWYPAVGSTMDVAADLARRGAPHGTVVRADVQTAGRGRQGRTWTAAPGSALLASWILRYSGGQEDVGALSPLVALAVARALNRMIPNAPIGIKWPNDVLIGGRKAAGVLLTSRATPAGMVVIAGTGINLQTEAICEGIVATSLSEWKATVPADQALDAVADSLGQVWCSFAERGSLKVEEVDEIESLLACRNEVVTLESGDGMLTGTLEGIAADGSLLLRTSATAAAVRIRTGEIVRGPRPTAPMSRDGCRILS